MRKSIIRSVKLFTKRLASKVSGNQGFSMIELITALAITLIVMGIAVATYSNALSIRAREGSRTDALNSSQAALNIMSREITNSGYGLILNGVKNNGIVVADSNAQRLHIRANLVNDDLTTDDPGEDITFYFDQQSQSVVRYDANTRLTSGIINRISFVEFRYYDYYGSTVSGPNSVPSENTGRITIILTVNLPDVQGQPANQVVEISSDVTMRNSRYMLGQY